MSFIVKLFLFLFFGMDTQFEVVVFFLLFIPKVLRTNFDTDTTEKS